MLAILAPSRFGFLTHSPPTSEPLGDSHDRRGLAIVVSRLDPEDHLQDVEWETLLFFAGLFIMVGSLVRPGRHRFNLPMPLPRPSARTITLRPPGFRRPAVLSGIIDNILYMSRPWPHLVHDLSRLPPPAARRRLQQSLWWVLALGADPAVRRYRREPMS